MRFRKYAGGTEAYRGDAVPGEKALVMMRAATRVLRGRANVSIRTFTGGLAAACSISCSFCPPQGGDYQYGIKSAVDEPQVIE